MPIIVTNGHKWNMVGDVVIDYADSHTVSMNCECSGIRLDIFFVDLYDQLFLLAAPLALSIW